MFLKLFLFLCVIPQAFAKVQFMVSIESHMTTFWGLTSNSGNEHCRVRFWMPDWCKPSWIEPKILGSWRYPGNMSTVFYNASFELAWRRRWSRPDATFCGRRSDEHLPSPYVSSSKHLGLFILTVDSCLMAIPSQQPTRRHTRLNQLRKIRPINASLPVYWRLLHNWYP